ncbi:NADH:flavin oxidoreductase/NADH oxidase [Ceratobasidium sp. AG-Ba]|nr:NADH:flavin oxidoreductase/NADH oxidase [Ceratobasidium sp. AG-Ba]
MNESLAFPCGRTVSNRLVKAAMYEAMANFGGGPPTDQLSNLYSEWAAGGWGMVITGNVQVSSQHLTLGRDVTLPKDDAELGRFRLIANILKSSFDGSKSISVMQLSHAGRQSPRFIGGRRPWVPPLAASSNPMAPSESLLARIVFWLLFQSPRPMTSGDISSVVSDFLHGAKTAYEAGFDGIQLHASHGFFIEPTIPSSFVVGVKLNAGDYAKDRLDENQALLHVRSIAEWGCVDFLEISGGDYESPDFLAKDSPRQAFFSTFSRKARECVSQVDRRPLIMLTGSIRSVDTISKCLDQKHADLIGIGRPSILYPDLPQRLMREKIFPPVPDTPALPIWIANIIQVKLVGAGLDTAMWVRAMKRLTRKDKRQLEGNAVDAFFHLFFNVTSILPYLIVFSLTVATTVALLGYYTLH